MYTFAANFQATSPYADLIPPLAELPRHPLQYLGACTEALRLHEEHEAAAAVQRRRERREDVAKRNEYRRAHGLEPASGVWGLREAPPPNPNEAPEQQAPDDASLASSSISAPAERVVTSADGAVGAGAGVGSVAPEQTAPDDGKRKKFFGIF